MYTENDFEEYSERIIRERCEKEGYRLDRDAMFGSIENNRDDAFDEDDNESYTDQDIWDEYLYFVLNDAFSAFVDTTPFAGRSMAPDRWDDTTFTFSVYKEGIIPYTRYDGDAFEDYKADYVDDHGTIRITNVRKA